MSQAKPKLLTEPPTKGKQENRSGYNTHAKPLTRASHPVSLLLPSPPFFQQKVIVAC